MTNQADGAVVVPLHAPDAPRLTSAPRPGKCQHLRVRVDVDDREVTCVECERVVDPISVLHRIATRFDREAGFVLAARRELERMKDEVAKLKAERSRVRGELRAAGVDPMVLGLKP